MHAGADDDSTALPTVPDRDAIRSLAGSPAEAGTVVWHREDLRIADNPALAAAADSAAAKEGTDTTVLPLFVFDPAFYGDRGTACDARIAFLHDSLRDLDRQYRDVGAPGLTYAHGDPIEVLGRFVDAGWDVVATRSVTGRYGLRRDERARDQLGVEFVDDDGLVRGADRPRREWKAAIESWLAADPCDWDPRRVAVERVAADPESAASADRDHGNPFSPTPESVAAAYDVTPEKSMVPEGGRAAGRDRLESFVARIGEYPGSISSPVDARGGTSGLSPYLRFGCLSLREVHRYVDERAPDGRGKSMFVSRLFWNRHYRQKLVDWPGWLDEAVNPIYKNFNRDRHDPELVAAWKAGETGFPMVDASMRCLRETGWLNFRMRALCASVYFHVLQQPWRIGADHFYEHLIDADAAINYTQWQSQCGLVGRPGLRLYNPRKQVRDQDPDGEFVTRWVPELERLPAEHLDRPDHAPLSVQAECGVEIGEEYPYPVVDYEAAREEFERRYYDAHPAAAGRLADESIARRASLSGDLDAARAIAEEHGSEASERGDGATGDGATASGDHRGRQTDLSAFDVDD
ncbi:FAD-binding domain-containing protein [Halorubrum sp. SD626R]|uniref:FAD-binding domain-containing protein n=1 Tax=Halorubrum sp. SD626R TaxID=1419722 RepID=UPI000AEB642E|nr:FAD-binding domain-containing protein [Halorubrum sp. SD626R]TKX81594.1 deoxyribodipyrimidine photo-lyase/cryptochrome family protein [Halorubrum sp. SD626R]